MKKKCRLEIPEMINKNLSPLLAETWLNYDGEVLSENQYKCAVADGISDWLEEIKQPEILTAEEMLLEMSVESPNNDQIMLHPNIIDYGEEMEKMGQRKLWHEGGVAELFEAALRIVEHSDHEIATVFLDLELALEKIQKPE